MDAFQHGGLNSGSKRCLPTNGAILLHFDVVNVSSDIVTPSLSVDAADSLLSSDYLEGYTRQG